MMAILQVITMGVLDEMSFIMFHSEEYLLAD